MVPERGLADEELVEENAEGPPVDGLAVTLVTDHFGGEVFWSATEGVGLAIVDLLSETKVNKLEVAIGVEQDVLRFEIAVGDALNVVQVFKDQRDFGDVEAGGGFVEPACTAEEGKDFAARTIL